MDEGTDEKGAKGDDGAPDDSSTGLAAVVNDDGVVCAHPIGTIVTEITKLKIISLNLFAIMAI
ncbi:hypothetical protein [Spirosoma panaciterrae]|uniref:hypothetical protein n=1 Tax=Spirosoma panaciterrae TaxID=496058 RepID=UPI000372387A|nr:hypothetical protein [Spirosoma panaciterrae]